MDFDYSNTLTLIIGGSSGIGFQIAKDISESGGAVIIAAKNRKKLAAASKLLSDCPHFAADIGEYKDCINLTTRIKKSYKKLDYFVFSAGIFHNTPIEKTTENSWNRVINTNLKSVFFLIKSLLPLLRRSKGKSIVLLSSILASFGAPNVSLYSASKSGILGLAKSLSIELAEDNIRINCISPSYVNTTMIRSLLENKKNRYELKSKHPIGRIGSPKDISNMVLFLLSEYSGWITGQNFAVDGGRSAKI